MTTQTKTCIRHHPLIIMPPGTITGIEPFVAEATRCDPDIPGSHAADAVEIGSVEPCLIMGLDAVVTKPSHPWHDDNWGEGTECYSALLVVRNDAGSWVETREKQKHPKQSVGTLVLLDLWRKHRLACPENVSPRALWVALNIDYLEVPTPERCISDMQKLVDKTIKGHDA